MLARARAWWLGRSRGERLILGIGAPVVAVAAWWGARQDKARRSSSAAPDEGEGGPGLEALPTSSPSILNAGAPGIGADQIAQFTEAFTGEIGGLEGQLDELEKQFGDTATERARSDAANQARIDDELADIRDEIARSAETRAPTSTGTKNTKNTQQTAAQAAEALRRKTILAIFKEEQLPPPSAARLTELSQDVARGRSYSSIRQGLEAFKRNRPGLGIPV